MKVCCDSQEAYLVRRKLLQIMCADLSSPNIPSSFVYCRPTLVTVVAGWPRRGSPWQIMVLHRLVFSWYNVVGGEISRRGSHSGRGVVGGTNARRKSQQEGEWEAEHAERENDTARYRHHPCIEVCEWMSLVARADRSQIFLSTKAPSHARPRQHNQR